MFLKLRAEGSENSRQTQTSKQPTARRAGVTAHLLRNSGLRIKDGITGVMLSLTMARCS